MILNIKTVKNAAQVQAAVRDIYQKQMVIKSWNGHNGMRNSKPFRVLLPMAINAGFNTIPKMKEWLADEGCREPKNISIVLNSIGARADGTGRGVHTWSLPA